MLNYNVQVSFLRSFQFNDKKLLSIANAPLVPQGMV